MLSVLAGAMITGAAMMRVPLFPGYKNFATSSESRCSWRFSEEGVESAFLDLYLMQRLEGLS
jgi:hypothetical protein